MNIQDRRADLQKRSSVYHNAEFHYPDLQAWHKAMTSIRLSMGDYIKDDKVRRLVLGWLFVKEGVELSTANLTHGQVETLRKWLVILPTGDGTWSISEQAAGELKQMAALFQKGDKTDGKEAVHPAQSSGYFHFEP